MKLLWNGVGFIRCTLNETTRINVYHPDLPPTVGAGQGSIHDHRFTMRSRVLVGKLMHFVYSVEKDKLGRHSMWSVTDDKFRFIKHVTVGCGNTKLVSAGEEEFHFGGPDWFHRVIPQGLTVTLVTRIEDVSKGKPCKVITTDDDTPNNAFDPFQAPAASTMKKYVKEALSGLTDADLKYIMSL